MKLCSHRYVFFGCPAGRKFVTVQSQVFKNAPGVLEFVLLRGSFELSSGSSIACNGWSTALFELG